MRHQKKKITLDRKTAARKSLMANLAESVILYERVSTTKAKAKAVKEVVDKLITVAKGGNLAARRSLSKFLYTKNVVKKLIENLAPRYAERNGGYTRIVALPPRKGDGAERAIIEFV